MDSRTTPVLVGVGQLDEHVDDPRSGTEPIEMMINALHVAADDAGCSDLLEKANSVRVIQGQWSYDDPARKIAQRLGAI